MKKSLKPVMALSAILGLSACAELNDQPEKTIPGNTPEQVTSEQRADIAKCEEEIRKGMKEEKLSGVTSIPCDKRF